MTSPCTDCGGPAVWFPLDFESGEPDPSAKEAYCDHCANERELVRTNA